MAHESSVRGKTVRLAAFPPQAPCAFTPTRWSGAASRVAEFLAVPTQRPGLVKRRHEPRHTPALCAVTLAASIRCHPTDPGPLHVQEQGHFAQSQHLDRAIVVAMFRHGHELGDHPQIVGLDRVYGDWLEARVVGIEGDLCVAPSLALRHLA